jgi:hypothetical protein
MTHSLTDLDGIDWLKERSHKIVSLSSQGGRGRCVAKTTSFINSFDYTGRKIKYREGKAFNDAYLPITLTSSLPYYWVGCKHYGNFLSYVNLNCRIDQGRLLNRF